MLHTNTSPVPSFPLMQNLSPMHLTTELAKGLALHVAPDLCYNKDRGVPEEWSWSRALMIGYPLQECDYQPKNSEVVH